MKIRAIHDGADKVVFDYEGCQWSGVSSQGVESLEPEPCEVDAPPGELFDDVQLEGVELGFDGVVSTDSDLRYVTGVATCQFEGGVRVVVAVNDRDVSWSFGDSGPDQWTREAVPPRK